MKIFKKLNKIQKISLAVVAAVLLCRLAGVTTAWFVGESSVLNHFGSHEYYVEIALLEPDWTSTGQFQAAAMQPGMDIYKNPFAVNLAEDECIVRMKIEISVGGTVLVEGSEAYDAIMSSIVYYNGSDILSYDDIGSYESYNTTEFEYYDGWYYYTGGGENCVQLAQGDRTAELFTDVVIPYTTALYQYFEKGFTINVIAEAMFSVGDYSVETAAARFDGTDTDEEETTTDEPTETSTEDETTTEESAETTTENGEDETTAAGGAGTALSTASLEDELTAADSAENASASDKEASEEAESGEVYISRTESSSGFGAESTSSGSALEVD